MKKKITVIDQTPYSQIAFPNKDGQTIYTVTAVIKALTLWDTLGTFQYELQEHTTEYARKVEQLISSYTR